jgi:hypothetical protein
LVTPAGGGGVTPHARRITASPRRFTDMTTVVSLALGLA